MPVDLVRRTFAVPPVAPHDAVAEANHRIANNLAMVSGLVRMYGRRIVAAAEPLDADDIRLLLEEIGSRIETVGRLHGLLARAGESKAIDISDYLREISEAVIASLTFAAKARLTYRSTGTCVMAPERALPIGFILVELVTNAVKYAHPTGVTGLITVTCSSVNSDVMVEVADDGVGWPEGFDPAENGGLGFRLMRSLADQINAKLTFDDTGTGLSARLQVSAV